jgi:hypothetical protein
MKLRSRQRLTVPQSSPNEWVTAVRRLANRDRKTGRPEGLPRTAAIKTALRAYKSACIKAQRFCIPTDQVAKPESPCWATRWTIGLIRTAEKVRDSEVCVGIFMVVLGPLFPFRGRLLSARSGPSRQARNEPNQPVFRLRVLGLLRHSA